MDLLLNVFNLLSNQTYPISLINISILYCYNSLPMITRLDYQNKYLTDFPLYFLPLMRITINFANMCDLEKFKLLFVETYYCQLESLPIRIYDNCIYMELHVEKFNQLSFAPNTEEILIYNHLRKPNRGEHNPCPYYQLHYSNLPMNLKRCTIMSIEQIICDYFPINLEMLEIVAPKINLDNIPDGILTLKINAHIQTSSFIKEKKIPYVHEDVMNLPRTLNEIYFYNRVIKFGSVEELIAKLFI